METFSALLFVWGIHRWPVTSPHKGQWRGALRFSLVCVWINGWTNNREAGDLRPLRSLWRHCNVWTKQNKGQQTHEPSLSRMLYIPHRFQSTWSGIVFCMRQAKERRRYIVTSFLIDWAHSQNAPCMVLFGIRTIVGVVCKKSVIQNSACWCNENAWWRHQTGTLSVLLAFCEGNHRLSTGGFPSQRPVTRSFYVFFHLHLNKRLSKQARCRWFKTPSCSLWHHCNESKENTGIFIVSADYINLVPFYMCTGKVLAIPRRPYHLLS